jgi:hypothetical protein
MKWTIDLKFRKKNWTFESFWTWNVEHWIMAMMRHLTIDLKAWSNNLIFSNVFNFQVGWPNQQNSVHYALRNKCHHPCANSWIIECTQRRCSTHIAHAGTLELLILGPWMCNVHTYNIVCNVHTYNIVCTSPSEKICEGDKDSGNGLGFKVWITILSMT